MPQQHQLRQIFEPFLFDPIGGLSDLESMFEQLQKAYPWVQQALATDPKSDWLRRGVMTSPLAPWVDAFFQSVLQLVERSEDPDWLRELLGQLCELLGQMPPSEEKRSIFYALLERLDWLDDQVDRAWTLMSLIGAAARQSEQRWLVAFFQECVRQTRMLSEEEEKARVVGHLAFSLGELGHMAWVPRLFEAVIAIIRTFRDDTRRRKTAFLAAEQFLGYERLRPELAHTPLLKHLALLLVTVGSSNEEETRAPFARLVYFLQKQLVGRFEIVPDSWEEVLRICASLDPWTHEELDLQGEIRWRLSPLPALLGVLGRDFCLARNRGWVQRFFHRLSERIFALPPGREREAAMSQMIAGLIDGFVGNERETLAWLQHILRHADLLESEPSKIYEGVFRGFLLHSDLAKATSAANRISVPQLRDRAFVELSMAWERAGQPQRAMVSLYEIGSALERGEAALLLSQSSAVVQDPVACGMLFRAVASLPAVAQTILQQVVQHPDFPKEAREAILGLSRTEPLSQFARNERLLQLEQVRAHLPASVYTAQRQRLLGLQSDEMIGLEDSQKEPLQMAHRGPQIVIDRPHAYGDGLYLKPSEHVQVNHFGDEVAGSRFSAWENFAQMWREIESTVTSRIQDDEGVQVIELEMPMDIGLTGVMALDDAPVAHLATEIRNGQPSLFCMADDIRQPTRTMTIVIGPSHIAPDEIEGYEGHELEHVLYTIYPGKPAYPFPRCDKEEYDRLETSLQAALSLLKADQIEEAKAVLYETYSNMEGSDESARYWSRHILIH